jgi:hypothetical protein
MRRRQNDAYLCIYVPVINKYPAVTNSRNNSAVLDAMISDKNVQECDATKVK